MQVAGSCQNLWLLDIKRVSTMFQIQQLFSLHNTVLWHVKTADHIHQIDEVHQSAPNRVLHFKIFPV